MASLVLVFWCSNSLLSFSSAISFCSCSVVTCDCAMDTESCPVLAAGSMSFFLLAASSASFALAS